MNQEQIREFYERNFYYILLADIGIGLLIGLIPLILGIRRKKRNLGIIGFVSCGLVGGFTPLVSILVAAIFAWLILRGPKKPAEVVLVNENPIDVSVKERDDQ